MSQSGNPSPDLAAAIEAAYIELSAAITEHEAVARKLEIKRAVYDALAKLAPTDETRIYPQKTVRRLSATARYPDASRGKAPGTLSKQWRTIMAAFVSTGNDAAPPDKWQTIASRLGFSINLKAARDWLGRAAKSEHRFIQETQNGFRVSDLAIEKFGLRNLDQKRIDLLD